MIKKFLLLIFVSFFSFFLFISFTNAEELTNYVVMDMNSRRVFYEKSSNLKKLPASTTKIMTT